MTRPADDVWFVYMLRCADGTLYTGITTDVPRRCRQHNNGTAARYTRSRLPARLVYQETRIGRGEALRREAAIKDLSRRDKLHLMKSPSNDVRHIKNRPGGCRHRRSWAAARPCDP